MRRSPSAVRRSTSSCLRGLPSSHVSGSVVPNLRATPTLAAMTSPSSSSPTLGNLAAGGPPDSLRKSSAVCVDTGSCLLWVVGVGSAGREGGQERVGGGFAVRFG